MNPSDPVQAPAFLRQLLQPRASSEGLSWLEERLRAYQQTGHGRTFFLTFSAVPRYLGKAGLHLSPDEARDAGALRPGFNPDGWTVDRLARIWLLLHLPAENPGYLEQVMTMLFDHADLGEAVALYSSLPLLPCPELFVRRAAEGVRSNMTAVFDAVALDNPYAADYFDEGAWNQLVLKAAFLDRPLFRIYGLDRRSNRQLAEIVSDYAHERWAAGRPVSPELWRLVAPFSGERYLSDIQRLLQSEDTLENQAGALLCAASAEPKLQKLPDAHPALAAGLRNGAFTWQKLSVERWQAKA